MNPEEISQQDTLIQNAINNHLKESQALQKMGEEAASKRLQESQELQKIGEKAGENAKSELEKMAQDMMNSSSIQQSQGQSQNNTSVSTAQKASGLEKSSNSSALFGATASLLFAIIFQVIFIKMARKRKENSTIAKVIYHYLKFQLFLSFVLFVGRLVSIYASQYNTVYNICAVVLIIIYIIPAITKNSKFKGNTVNSAASYKSSGIIIGATNGKLITKPESKSGHILVCGGTGKGKSQCVTIPSLLNWEGSALVVDIKREIYAYTNKVQASKGKVIVFDPEQNGHGYDPIKECYNVDSCQFLARTLIPTPPNTDPFWAGNAQSVLAAACFEGNKKGQTLPEIAERILITDPQILVDELTSSRYKETILLASSVKGSPEKTLGGIFTELKSRLVTLATDPNIRQALSKSEWTPETLEEGATIYLRVSEKQIETYKQVWSLIVVQILRHLAGRPEQGQPPILLLLDELPRLGKVEGYGSSLPTLRSKNVTIVSAIQSLAQLQEHYGREVTRTIMDNNAYKLVLSAGDNETQKVFSDLAGKNEVRKKSTNVSLGGGGVSSYYQWEEKYRPENFAYLSKPIFYPPDGAAFEVEKVFWMNIPHLLKLQKHSGGPTSFLGAEEIQKLSTFKRDGAESLVNIGSNIQPDAKEKELERIRELNQEVAVTSINSNTSDTSEGNEFNNDSEGRIELLEKWNIK